MINPMHGEPIEILLVEDSPDDAALTIDALQDGRVQNRIIRGGRRRRGDGLPAPRGTVRRRAHGRT